jgi:hypothetical protein
MSSPSRVEAEPLAAGAATGQTIPVVDPDARTVEGRREAEEAAGAGADSAVKEISARIAAEKAQIADVLSEIGRKAESELANVSRLYSEYALPLAGGAAVLGFLLAPRLFRRSAEPRVIRVEAVPTPVPIPVPIPAASVSGIEGQNTLASDSRAIPGETAAPDAFAGSGGHAGQDESSSSWTSSILGAVTAAVGGALLSGVTKFLGDVIAERLSVENADLANLGLSDGGFESAESQTAIDPGFGASYEPTGPGGFMAPPRDIPSDPVRAAGTSIPTNAPHVGLATGYDPTVVSGIPDVADVPTPVAPGLDRSDALGLSVGDSPDIGPAGR